MKNKLQMAINILVIIFMPFMMYINISDIKINTSISDIMLVLVGIVFIFSIEDFIKQKRWVYLLYFTGIFLSLFLSQYISQLDDNFLHVENSVMFIEMIKALVVAMYFFTALIFIKNERDFKVSLAAVSLSSIPVIIMGLTSYIFFLLGKDFFIDIYKIKTSRFLGSFEDPNLCAFYFLIVFFISLLNFKVQKRRYIRFLMVGISIFSSIIIILTMSRGGWIALAGGIIIFLILNIRSIGKESLLLVIIIIIILIAVDLDYSLQYGKITNNMIYRVQDSLSKDADEIDRIQLMKAAFEMGNDNFFFGVGKGSFPLNSYKYLSEDSEQYKMGYIPHNTILGFYAQQGIVGVIIFITLPGYILFCMIRSGRKQNLYLIPLLAGVFIHSMTINVENIRFIWYILGLMLVMENLNINLEFVPYANMNKKAFKTVLAVLLLMTLFFYIDLSRKIAINIYISKGAVYEKKISVLNPGEYKIFFDIHSDAHLNYVEIYDNDKLLDKLVFNAAYGAVQIPVYIEDECKLVFKSHDEGWMKVKNAYFSYGGRKKPLYNYLLLPAFMEDWSDNHGLLVYMDEPSLRKQFIIGNDELSAFDILDWKVTRYSNLSHTFQFNLRSKRRVDIDYQLDILLDYYSVSNLLPGESKGNLSSFRLTLYPYTSRWKEGVIYNIKGSRLLSSEGFNLYGRYYDYTNKIYSQDSYFPIQYNVAKEKQDIIELGDSQWVNIRYNKDKENLIHMTSNGWVETERMNLPKGDHEITFKAQGTFLEEYSKLRLRDSFLNKLAEVTLDGTMKEYTIKYHTDEEQQGISFVLELINYKSEEGIGSRKVLLEDWLKVK